MCFIHLFIYSYLVVAGVWVFCGLGFGIMMFLLFTFQCRGSGLQYRYGMAFRIFMAVSFTCFCLGIVMLVYPSLLPSLLPRSFTLLDLSTYLLHPFLSSPSIFKYNLMEVRYTQSNSRNSNSFGWSFAAWVFSYLFSASLFPSLPHLPSFVSPLCLFFSLLFLNLPSL